jgi:prepilin-type N-terminal cleavage/methylation domain-containing protein
MPRQQPVTPAARGRVAPARAGLTLVELMAAIVLFGIVAGTIMALVTRQQRYYAGASEVMDVRGQIREAASLLPIDLRGTSSAGGDIMFAGDSAMEFRATYGTAVVCRIDAPNRILDVLPTNLARHTLSSWYTTPVAGDTLFVFDEGPTQGAQDDLWGTYRLENVGTRTDVCIGAPFADPVQDAPALKPRWRFTMDRPIAATVVPGAVIRFTRRVRYSLYHSPTDNLWYLGYKSMNNGAWGAVQPVSGPYRSYSATAGQSGLSLTYFDTNSVAMGNTVVGRRSIARISVTVRGQGQMGRNAAASLKGPFRDSLSLHIALRNRQ